MQHCNTFSVVINSGRRVLLFCFDLPTFKILVVINNQTKDENTVNYILQKHRGLLFYQVIAFECEALLSALCATDIFHTTPSMLLIWNEDFMITMSKFYDYHNSFIAVYHCYKKWMLENFMIFTH